MHAHVSQQLEEALKGRSLTIASLVIGSTCMRDFFDSAMQVAGITTHPKPEYSAEEVDRLFAAIAGKPYESLGDYFPINLKFMFGADKLLINVQELLKKTKATSIIPTNDSLSTSLVRLASDEGDLGRIGLRISHI